jgi:hypothetical protein
MQDVKSRTYGRRPVERCDIGVDLLNHGPAGRLFDNTRLIPYGIRDHCPDRCISGDHQHWHRVGTSGLAREA